LATEIFVRILLYFGQEKKEKKRKEKKETAYLDND